MPNKRATEEARKINKSIGRLIRNERILQCKTLEQLSEVSGVTFQQILKYENGVNGIPIFRLIAIAEELKKPTAYFISGMPEEEYDPVIYNTNRSQISNLVRAFNKIKDDKVKQNILSLIYSLDGEKDDV